MNVQSTKTGTPRQKLNKTKYTIPESILHYKQKRPGESNHKSCTKKQSSSITYTGRLPGLDVLPGKLVGGDVHGNGEGVEAKAVTDIAGGDGRVLQRGKHLPVGLHGGSLAGEGGGGGSGRGGGLGALGNGAGHEARGALAVVGPGAEGGASSGRSVLEGALGGAGGHVGRVGEGEAQSTGGVNVDALATGDDDILYI